MAKDSKISNSITHDISRTGDVKTNDFNLDKEKTPALSTLKAQIKTAMSLIERKDTTPARIKFDRLRIGINLGVWGSKIKFADYAMEDVENPKEPPSYLNKNEGDTLTRRSFIHEEDDDEEYERFRRLAIEKYLIDDEEMISNLYRRHMQLKEERESIEEDELEHERRIR